MKVKKIILSVLALIIVGGAIFAFLFYNYIYDNNIVESDEEYILFIDPNSSFDDVRNQLTDREIIIDSKSFEIVSKLMSYNKSKVPAGRYIIPKTYSNRQLISMLRSGRQSAVNLTINNVRTLEDLSGKISKNILLDSLSVLEYLMNEEIQKKYGYSQETFMSLFIPNTYKVYWDINEEKLLDRMVKEHKKFWNPDREKKAKKLEMTKEEVYTLASIVDKESLVKSEKPRIAGVYMNRLKKNIALQADPTVVFALKKFDLRRVLNKHLEFDSPYNTYIYPGLPQGPIAMATISGLDAILDYEDHQFIYFCAKPNGNGKHAFAKTLQGHNKNAKKYWHWLNSRGIR